ncbi:tetratricopeptide repeat protein [Porphyromonas endodontalis]|uniref:tetratricopeptide repeat protein n=1 Tax=Porphyromonas endodontalis TaxID=28124 RepID=UPI003C7D0E65
MKYLYTLLLLLCSLGAASAQEISAQKALSDRLFAEGASSLLSEKPLLAYYQILASYQLDPSGASAFALGNLLRPISVEQAAEWYRKAFEADPSHDEYAFQYGYTLASKGETDELLRMLDRHIQLSPSDSRNQLLALGVLLEEQQYDQVSQRLPALLEASRGTPYYAHALQVAQRVAFETHDTEAMNRYLDAALEYNGNSLSDLTSLLFNVKQNLSAEIAYNLLQKIPQSQRASGSISYAEASILLDLNRYPEVFGVLQRIWKADGMTPEFSQEALHAFLSEFVSKDLDLAPFLPIYKEFIAAYPSNFDAHLDLQSLLYMLDKPSERQAQLVRMTKLFPTGHPELWNALFQNFISREKFDEVYKYFPQAIKQYPKEGSLYLFKSLAEETAGELERARETALQGIAQTDTTETEVIGDLYGQVGDICAMQEKYTEAIAAYEESIKLNGKNPNVLNNYAYFLLGLEQPAVIEKAVRMASKAVALQPGEFRYLDTYGFALFLQGDYLQAEIYLRQAIERAEAALKEDPSSISISSLADYYYHYAKVQEEVGNLQTSLLYLQKVKQLVSTDEIDLAIEEIKRRMESSK